MPRTDRRDPAPTAVPALPPTWARDLPPLRGQKPVTGPAGEGLEVRVCGVMQAADLTEPWAALSGRAMDDNAFYHPDFALAAVRHLREVARPVFVMVLDPRGDGPAALKGVFPVVMPRIGMGQFELFGWRHDQMALGLPLVARESAGAVVHAFFDWIESQGGAAGGLLLPLIAEDTATAAAIAAGAESRGRTLRRFGEHARAILTPDATTFDDFLGRVVTARRLKEIRRQRRRLGEQGDVVLHHCSSPLEVREATEAFLTLEAAGWKGREGTAFLHSPSHATFLRSVTRGLAQRGLCRIDLLTVGERVAAAGIVLGGLDRALYWKTTFDETLSALSPGVQLTLDLSRRQWEGAVAVTDSCAVADHPMIDRLWPDRSPVADWFIEAGTSRTASALAAAGVSARRGLRSTAKSLYHLARGKKG
ncbi:GNAT family N-acetyltransferase [Alsobacter sp. R-9]